MRAAVPSHGVRVDRDSETHEELGRRLTPAVIPFGTQKCIAERVWRKAVRGDCAALICRHHRLVLPLSLSCSLSLPHHMSTFPPSMLSVCPSTI